MNRTPSEEEMLAEVQGIEGLREARVTAKRRVEAHVSAGALRGVIDALLARHGFLHLSAISGMDTGDDIALVYHLAFDGLVLSVFTRVPRERPEIDSIVDLVPGASAQERELHDLLGVMPRGNEHLAPLVLPEEWPDDVYPLRKDAPAGKMRPANPGSPVIRDSSEYNLPVGPQHPALKEPESFRFKVEGEIVTGIDVRLGYSHRGIEKACESRTYMQCLYLIERICGICSHSHLTAFAQGVEAILGLEVPRRAKYIRTIVGELERIHSHMMWLGVAGHEVGFDSLLMYAWRDREAVQDTLELISGNRVNYAISTFGGVRRDIAPEQAEAVRDTIRQVESRLSFYEDVVGTEPTLAARLRNVGVLTKEQALRHCTVGPVARASGVDLDLRRDDPYAAYEEIPFTVVTSDGCDLFARVTVKLREIGESLKIVRYALDNMPDGPISVKFPRRVTAGYAVSRYEAPRGEDIHFIVADGLDHPVRVKVRAPTLANIPAIIETMKGSYIADIPIIIAGIDPCFSCTDRSVVLDDGGEPRRMTWEQLRRYGVEWYHDRI